MPLINSDSDEALKKNIKIEIAAGKDPKQAVAIALDVQRKAKANKKKTKHDLADPQAKLSEINFDAIQKALESATPEDSGHGTMCRYVSVGTIEQLSPSGKYFICWTGDHSNPEIDADVEFWNGFQAKLEEFPFAAWLEHDGNQIKIGAHMESDQPKNFEEMCPNCGKPMTESGCCYSASTGDMVSWDSAGGRAEGKIKKIITDGKVPGIPVKVTGTKESPAALIEVYRDGKPSGVMVGHKLDSVSKK
jgi:hypothetical protein